MTVITEFIREQIVSIKDILSSLIELVSIVGKNKVLVIALAIAAILYLGLRYYAFEVPKDRLYAFHKYIDNQKYDEAWAMMSKRYKRKYYQDNINNFKNEANPNGMGRFSDIKISDEYDYFNPFAVLTKDDLAFTVYTTRTTIVSINDLKDSGNSYHRFRTKLWLQLSYNRHLNQITNGNYGPQLDYETILKRRYFLVKEQGDWVIDDNPKIYEGYKYKNYSHED